MERTATGLIDGLTNTRVSAEAAIREIGSGDRAMALVALRQVLNGIDRAAATAERMRAAAHRHQDWKLTIDA